MPAESARARARNETRNRILDVALDVLGRNSAAGMGEIAAEAGVVRRTIYGHFPARSDLVHTLTQRAVSEIVALLTEVTASRKPADVQWVDFIVQLWPVAHRYRVLLALRRGEYGDDIHTLLQPVDTILADLVQRGQDSKIFASHLPAAILSQLAYGAVFTIADSPLPDQSSTARAATLTSLLLLGVPESRARALALPADR